MSISISIMTGAPRSGERVRLRLEAGLVQREDFRNVYLNLALPLFALSEPEEAEEFELPQPTGAAEGAASPGGDAEGRRWNTWSKVTIAREDDLSLQVVDVGYAQ